MFNTDVFGRRGRDKMAEPNKMRKLKEAGFCLAKQIQDVQRDTKVQHQVTCTAAAAAAT